MPAEGPSAYRSWYPILMVIMCLRMVLNASISLRGVPKAVHTVYSTYAIFQDKKIPTYNSVRRWIMRLGLYKLSCSLEKGDDWAAIVDASVQVGEHKCLVILGIRLSQMEVGRALALEDLTVIALEMHSQCNALTVSVALERAAQRVGGFKMICADQGADILAGVALFQQSSLRTGCIADITHRVALFLKHELEGDEEWAQFCQLAAQTKSRVQQTDFAHLSPPNQRSKCRFMNLEGLVNWGKRMLLLLDRAKSNPKCNQEMDRAEGYFGWLRAYRNLIDSCDGFMEVVRQARHIVRTEGVHCTVGERLEEVLLPIKLSENACQLAGEVIDFVKEQAKMVPQGEIWIGSSECIESLFGKLKHVEQDQHKDGFTGLVLAAAACVGKTDVGIVDNALRSIKNKDVSAWEKENIGTTLQALRKRELGRVGPVVGRDSSGSQEEDLAMAI